MKKIINKILFNFGLILSFVININILYIIRILLNKIFTGFISSSFRKIGENCTIDLSVKFNGMKYIEFGNNVTICKNVDLTAWNLHNGQHYNPRIILGNNVSIGKNAHITAINEIIIKDNVLLGKFITITDNSHGDTDYESLQIPPTKRNVLSNGKVLINENVWIGDKVTILPNVIIGKNSIIGANSVVVNNIPDNCVAVGIPAKVIKKY